MKSCRKAHRWRVGWGLAALLLVGPTPGSVGSCDEDGAPADPVNFCQERESWICARRRARGEFGQDEAEASRAVQECVDGIADRCTGVSWPANCDPFPTTLTTRACIDQLMDPDNLDTSIADIEECDVRGALCAVRSEGADADGGVSR